MKTLPPTDLTPEHVAEWRQGGARARAVTPQGYLGAPAQASADRGRTRLEAEADAYAGAMQSAVLARTAAPR